MPRLKVASVVLLLCAGWLYAGEYPVSVGVRPLLGDRRSGSGWVPILVTLTNESNSELALDIVLTGRRTQSEARRSVVLPRGKRPRNYILYQYQDRGWGWGKVLLYRNGELLATKEERYQWPQQISVFVLGIARADNALEGLKKMPLGEASPFVKGSERWGRQGIAVKMIDRANIVEPLPDHFVGYHCCDMVVLNDCAINEFTEAEREALVNWVHKGGEIVLSPGSNEKWLRHEFIRRLVKIDGIEKDLFRGGIVGRNAKVCFYTLDIPGAKPWPPNSSRRTRLAGRVPCGLGGVTVLSIDLSEKAVADWSKIKGMWQGIIGQKNRSGQSKEPGLVRANPHRHVLPQGSDGYYSPRYSANLAKLLAVAKIPSLALIAGLICFYILIAGPGNFIVLRRKRLMAYLPLALALIVTAYVGIIFVTGYISKGVVSKIQKVSLIELIPGTGRAYQRTFFSIFSSAPRTYTISNPSRSAVVPFGAGRQDRTRMTCLYNGNVVLADHHMSMWSTDYFASEGFIDDAGAIAFEDTPDGLKITNGTKFHLRDAHVCCTERATGNRLWFAVGDVPPSQSATAAKQSGRHPYSSKFEERAAFQPKAGRRVLQMAIKDIQGNFVLARIDHDPSPPDVGTVWVRTTNEASYVVARMPGADR